MQCQNAKTTEPETPYFFEAQGELKPSAPYVIDWSCSTVLKSRTKPMMK
jgi:hypothetical protein